MVTFLVSTLERSGVIATPICLTGRPTDAVLEVAHLDVAHVLDQAQQGGQHPGRVRGTSRGGCPRNRRLDASSCAGTTRHSEVGGDLLQRVADLAGVGDLDYAVRKALGKGLGTVHIVPATPQAPQIRCHLSVQQSLGNGLSARRGLESDVEILGLMAAERYAILARVRFGGRGHRAGRTVISYRSLSCRAESLDSAVHLGWPVHQHAPKRVVSNVYQPSQSLHHPFATAASPDA